MKSIRILFFLILCNICLLICETESVEVVETHRPCENSKLLVMKRGLGLDEKNRVKWNGTISLRDYPDLYDFRVTLVLSCESKVVLAHQLDRQARLYANVRKFHIVFNESSSEVGEINFIVEPKTDCKFPQVESLQLNGDELCRNPKKWYASINNNDDQLRFDENENIWPWFASLVRISNDNSKFFVCGAVIINEKTIITAASCFYGFEDKTLEKNKFEVALGQFDPNPNDAQYNNQDLKIDKLIIHPGYLPYSYEYNNIALILLGEEIELNEFTQPIALCDDNCFSLNTLSTTIPKLIGWGPETQQTSLVVSDFPIISHLNCLRSNKEYFSGHLYDKNYCAGNVNGSTICAGFGGSGMATKIGNKWYLQGIVSTAPPNRRNTYPGQCYTENYVIFINLVKYKSWISSNQRQIVRLE